MDLTPLVDAIHASGLTPDELADRADVLALDVERLLTGDDQTSEYVLWQLAQAVGVASGGAATAGWPERLVVWLRRAQVGETEGFESLWLDDRLAPGYYLAGTSDDRLQCIVQMDEFGRPQLWRPGQSDLYAWRPIRQVSPDDSPDDIGLVRCGSPHRWEADDEVWIQAEIVELRRIPADEVDSIQRSTNPDAGRPIVAIDIDGVLRPMVPAWLVGDPPLQPVPPLPEGVAADDRVSVWYDRDGWRARFAELHGPRALVELDRLRLFALTVDWRTWPITRLHTSWVRSFGTTNRDEATPDAVPFVQDAARSDWHYVPEHLAAEPIETKGSSYHQRWWTPETAVLEVLLVPWVGRWVRRLQARGVQVVWATTWGEPAANGWFGAALDIPPLEWGQAGTPPRMSEETISWKVRSLRRRYVDRPIAMLDDQPWSREGRDALDLRAGGRRGGAPVSSLLVRVDGVRGLTRADARRVDRWLDAISREV